MRTRVVAYLMCAVVCAHSCGDGYLPDPPAPLPESVIEGRVYYVGMNGSKVYIDDFYNFRWTSGDRLSVFRSSRNERYRYTGETGSTGGEIVKDDATEPSTPFTYDYLVTPYSTSSSMQEEGILDITMPDVQTYVRDSFDPAANWMIAVADDTPEGNKVYLRPACGYIGIKAFGEGKVTSLRFYGNNDESLAGTARIEASRDEAPSLLVTGGGKVITVDCGEGVELSPDNSHPTTFWIVLPPVTFSAGFTVEITTDRGTYSKTTGKTITVNRNGLKPMTPIRCAEPIATIACWGNSYTVTGGGWPNHLQTLLGPSYTVYAGGKGSDTTIDIGTRNGCVKTYVKGGFTFPADCSTVEFEGVGAEECAYTLGTEKPFNNARWDTKLAYDDLINPCIVAGVECRMTGHTVKRLAPGDPVIVPAGTEISTYGSRIHKDVDLTILYLGANGGWSKDINILIRQNWLTVLATKTKRYIVLAYHSSGWAYLKDYNVAFGTHAYRYYPEADGRNHVVDLCGEVVRRAEELLVRTGAYSSPDEISPEDRECIARGEWPDSMWFPDGHPNEYGAKAISILVHDKMKELGYID